MRELLGLLLNNLEANVSSAIALKTLKSENELGSRDESETTKPLDPPYGHEQIKS